MSLRRPVRKVIEAFSLTLIALGLNLIVWRDTSSALWSGSTYLLTAIVVTAFYGLAWGAYQLACVVLVGLVVAPLILGVFSPTWLDQEALALQFVGPLAGLVCLAAGLFHLRRGQVKQQFLTTLREQVHQGAALQRKADSLERVNRVLENRVINQKDSITLLRSQVHKLSSLNLEQALATVLETIHLFTEMRSGSIWVMDPQLGELVTAAVYGWNLEGSQDRVLSPEASIEGYVLRNGKAFSVRMVMETQEFSKLDFQNNILTLPIRVKGQVWGVLNIEDLPFERYSLYTESVLEIVLSLVEPYLAEILDHAALFDQQEVDEDTQLPQVTKLYQTLERELERRGQTGASVSLIVLEVSNFASLTEQWPRRELKKLFAVIKTALDKAHEMNSRAFHFKNDSQMAFLMTGLDQDGTSFLCLDLLSMIASLGLTIADQPVPLEVIVGFSTSHDAGQSGKAMIDMAEVLLTMQRL